VLILCVGRVIVLPWLPGPFLLVWFSSWLQ
jgi:hypothetical protein